MEGKHANYSCFFYTISDNYTTYAYVSIQSLIDHADPNQDYTITLLVQKISAAHKQSLEDLSTDNVHVKIFHINDEMVKPIHKTKENYLRAQFFTMSIFFIVYSSLNYSRNMTKPFT